MTVRIDLPDELEADLRARWGGDLSRVVLEALVAEAYRDSRISVGRVAELLNLPLYEADAFLHRRGLLNDCSCDELERDQQTLDRLLAP